MQRRHEYFQADGAGAGSPANVDPHLLSPELQLARECLRKINERLEKEGLSEVNYENLSFPVSAPADPETAGLLKGLGIKNIPAILISPLSAMALRVQEYGGVMMLTFGDFQSIWELPQDIPAKPNLFQTQHLDKNEETKPICLGEDQDGERVLLGFQHPRTSRLNFASVTLPKGGKNALKFISYGAKNGLALPAKEDHKTGTENGVPEKPLTQEEYDAFLLKIGDRLRTLRDKHYRPGIPNAQINPTSLSLSGVALNLHREDDPLGINIREAEFQEQYLPVLVYRTTDDNKEIKIEADLDLEILISIGDKFVHLDPAIKSEEGLVFFCAESRSSYLWETYEISTGKTGGKERVILICEGKDCLYASSADLPSGWQGLFTESGTLVDRDSLKPTPGVDTPSSSHLGNEVAGSTVPLSSTIACCNPAISAA